MRVATHPALAKYIFKVFFIEERQRVRKIARMEGLCDSMQARRPDSQGHSGARNSAFSSAAQMAVPSAISSLMRSRQPAVDLGR
jgi:hypothetical protein